MSNIGVGNLLDVNVYVVSSVVERITYSLVAKSSGGGRDTERVICEYVLGAGPDAIDRTEVVVEGRRRQGGEI